MPAACSASTAATTFGSFEVTPLGTSSSAIDLQAISIAGSTDSTATSGTAASARCADVPAGPLIASGGTPTPAATSAALNLGAGKPPQALPLVAGHLTHQLQHRPVPRIARRGREQHGASILRRRNRPGPICSLRIVVIGYLDPTDRMGHHDVMNLEVNPGLLRLAAADVATLQDCVQTVFDDLRSDLASRGTAWQHGSFGTAFAGGPHGYLVAEDELFHSAQNLATTLGHYSSAMSKAADAWAIADGELPAKIGGA